jgi:putative transposase
MAGMPGGRKHPVHQPIVERFNEPEIVFLTVCTEDRKRLLAKSDVAALLMDSWSEAKGWLVGRYIVMPDHVHLFCAPGGPPARLLKQWVRYWKTLASRGWPRVGEQPVWQVDFWDTQLRSVAHYDEKWEYVRQNPVRAGLVNDPEEWPHQGELNELRW